MNALFGAASLGVEEAQSLRVRQDLSPAQRAAYERLLATIDVARLVSIEGIAGAGKTTLLQLVARDYRAEWVSTAEIVRAVRMGEARASSEAVFHRIERALDQSDVVVVDGVELLGYGWIASSSLYPTVDAICSVLQKSGKRLVVSGYGHQFDHFFPASPNRISRVGIGDFEREDYVAFLTNILGARAIADVDMDLVWRHAPGLSGHDLRNLGELLVSRGNLRTSDIIECLDRHIIASNVALEEVEALSFADLPGTDQIAAKLETHVIVPFENAALARELDIKPKRGILLYGPPGSGKTSIGRALAHRLQGKFFLIDGSIATEPPHEFFGRIKAVVQAAKDNAPSILFVDDADVLFGIEHISGFARYLLSFLDGVESESAGRVCLMMTAMDAGKIPSAVLRSGRVELWLETRAPDDETRAAIVRRWLEGALPGEADIDFDAISRATAGFTPADLRRIAADAKALYAIDMLREKIIDPAATYLQRAIANLIALRTRMADNLQDESLRITSLSQALPYTSSRSTDRQAGAAKYGAGIGGLVEADTTCVTKKW